MGRASRLRSVTFSDAVAAPHCGMYTKWSQRRFCAAYLGESDLSSTAVTDLAKQVLERVPDSHRFWADWAEASYTEGPFLELYLPARRAMANVNTAQR